MAINLMSFCHLNEHVVDRIKMITNPRQAGEGDEFYGN